MRRISAFNYETRWGTFSIRENRTGYWSVMFRDENLGNYRNPIAALDDLLGDHCCSNSADLDTSEIGLPDDLGDWEAIRVP